jgi:hypothetical protein
MVPASATPRQSARQRRYLRHAGHGEIGRYRRNCVSSRVGGYFLQLAVAMVGSYSRHGDRHRSISGTACGVTSFIQARAVDLDTPQRFAKEERLLVAKVGSSRTCSSA